MYYTILGMTLVAVGIVLFTNGLWLLGRGNPNDIAILNFFVGTLEFVTSIWWAFSGSATNATAFDSTGTLLFAFTYLWIGANAIRGIDDQRSFGWFCILVTAIAIPTGYIVWQTDPGLAVLWWIWAVLWATFWLLYAREQTDYTKPIGWFTSVTGVVTGICGFLMAAGYWPWG